jgi:hypothetical protein
MAKDLSIDHPATIADYLQLLARTARRDHKVAEACTVSHFRRFYPKYYIKEEGEVDIAYVDGGRFWPVEIKWTGYTSDEPGAYGIYRLVWISEGEPIPWEETVPFRRGDANTDGTVNVADAVCMLGHLFTGGAAPGCLDAGDANDDGVVNIADALALLNHLFARAGDLPEPFGACGEDPTEDVLGCARYDPCVS